MFEVLAAAQGKPERIFDGSTLSGWDGDPAVWSVKDGCITGRSDGTSPKSAVLHVTGALPDSCFRR